MTQAIKLKLVNILDLDPASDLNPTEMWDPDPNKTGDLDPLQNDPDPPQGP